MADICNDTDESSGFIAFELWGAGHCYCPQTRMCSLLRIRQVRMRKILWQMESCYFPSWLHFNSASSQFVVPLQRRCGPEGSRRSRLPDFHDIRHMNVVRSSALRTGRLYPQECSWYSFSLGAESTPGLWCGRNETCHWKIQWHHRESIPGPTFSQCTLLEMLDAFCMCLLVQQAVARTHSRPPHRARHSYHPAGIMSWSVVCR